MEFVYIFITGEFSPGGQGTSSHPDRRAWGLWWTCENGENLINLSKNLANIIWCFQFGKKISNTVNLRSYKVPSAFTIQFKSDLGEGSENIQFYFYLMFSSRNGIGEEKEGNRIKSLRQKSTRKKSPRKNPFECRWARTCWN